MRNSIKLINRYTIGFLVTLCLIVVVPVSGVYALQKKEGNLSLLQVNKKTPYYIFNQRDDSSPTSWGISYVGGRTKHRMAVNISSSGGILLPKADNFTYDEGTILFWIKSDIWNDHEERWLVKVDAEAIDNPGDKTGFEIKKHPDSSGIDTLLVSIGSNNRIMHWVENELNADEWYLIALTYKQGEKYKLYIDNIVFESPITYNGMIPYSGKCGESICWGSWYDLFGSNSTFEDMQTFNYPLVLEEIEKIYQSKHPSNYHKGWN